MKKAMYKKSPLYVKHEDYEFSLDLDATFLSLTSPFTVPTAALVFNTFMKVNNSTNNLKASDDTHIKHTCNCTVLCVTTGIDLE